MTILTSRSTTSLWSPVSRRSQQGGRRVSTECSKYRRRRRLYDRTHHYPDFWRVMLPCCSAMHSTFHHRFLATIGETTLHSPSTPLLREWVKLKLTGGSWRDALVAARNVIISFLSTLRGLYTPLASSLQPQDSRFITLSVTNLK